MLTGNESKYFSIPFDIFKSMIKIGQYKKSMLSEQKNKRDVFPSYNIILLAKIIKTMYDFEETGDAKKLETTPTELFNITHRRGKNFNQTYSAEKVPLLKRYKASGFLQQCKHGYIKVSPSLMYNISMVAKSLHIPNVVVPEPIVIKEWCPL